VNASISDMQPSFKVPPAQQPQSFDTTLNAQQTTQYQAWLKQMAAAGYATGNSDYDMQGAFLAGVKPNPTSKHYPDQFKKPNHMTFSTESQYHGKPYKGGEWKQVNGKWSFYASPDNLKFNNREALINYFKTKEAKSSLYLPGETKPAYTPP